LNPLPNNNVTLVTKEELVTATPQSDRDNRNLLETLGPGLITGAADDDPSGIATYSQAGAQFGLGLLWTILFTYPLMAVIQEISARIGRVSGRGIAGNMRRYYPRSVMYFVVSVMLVANILNLGADIGAMGSAVNLIFGGPTLIYAVVLAGISLVLQVFVPYKRYVNVLKWLTISLFAYVAILFLVHVDWIAVAKATLIPHIQFSSGYLTTLIAVFGTTISPYLFFWQASQEVEEEEKDPLEHPLKHDEAAGPAALRRIRLDTYSGMAFSNLISFFIILTAAVTLHAHGKMDIQTASDAAEALRPLAGPFTFYLFALGIIGTALLAIPVLGGSAAYGVAEMFGWKIGLSEKPLMAKQFYAVIAAATVIGCAINFTHIDPIKALYWSAVLNGVVSVPVMVVMMFMSTNRRVMGKFVISKGMRLMGWIATAAMAAAVVGLFITL
jgi:NRAMP (natural resistance-associated macrophage protein)-like metal ion transporter